MNALDVYLRIVSFTVTLSVWPVYKYLLFYRCGLDACLFHRNRYSCNYVLWVLVGVTLCCDVKGQLIYSMKLWQSLHLLGKIILNNISAATNFVMQI